MYVKVSLVFASGYLYSGYLINNGEPENGFRLGGSISGALTASMLLRFARAGFKAPVPGTTDDQPIPASVALSDVPKELSHKLFFVS